MHVDLRLLQVFDVTVFVYNKSDSLESLLFDSLVVLIVSGCSKAYDLPVLMIDLIPKGLEVIEHDLVAFVNNEHAFFIGFNTAQITDIVQSFLCVGFDLVQDAEQSFVFFVVTIFQTLIQIDHVHMHF